MTLTTEQSATLTAVAAIVWPLIQAALDRPYWTAARRRVIAMAAIAVIAAGTWFAGAYPATAAAATNQVLSVAGLVLGAFNVLKSAKINGISILDWAGIVTPGGVALRKSEGGAHKA
jgi:hypothetical protein|nr:MAG TPA: hypothetical protein [Caudoviricetes sp.]